MTIIRWTGLEVAALRTALRDTQVQFADRIGCSIESVGKWERRGADITLGAKYSECMDTARERLDDEQGARFDAVLGNQRNIPSAEAALDLRPWSHTSAIRPGRAAALKVSRNGSVDGGIFQMRRVIMGCIPDSAPADQHELTAAVARAWDLFFSARFDEMQRELPVALASGYSAAESAAGEQLREINMSMAKLLHAASNFLGYVAHEDLAALALLRAEALAAESGDELTLAAARGSRSWLLAKNGMYDDAAACADQVASEIEPRLSTATPRHIAIWGELLCYAAFAASGAGDYREARSYLRLGEAAGTQLEGDYASRPEASNVFGHISAASFGVVNEVAANRPRQALKLAAVVTGRGNGIPPTLRSRWLVNVAQAQMHDHDDAGAVDTLARAWSLAPELICRIPLAHRIVNELSTRRGGKRIEGLVGIAERVGVSVQAMEARP
ncbi:helix-turn-helix domain-containing protein [Nocardia grenadensis]|uniref:helix-turn-helix domain-containing protein n=1 Tax=Nocardia grenadensis TaxID=931537 RepID=UPI003D708CB3